MLRYVNIMIVRSEGTSALTAGYVGAAPRPPLLHARLVVANMPTLKSSFLPLFFLHHSYLNFYFNCNVIAKSFAITLQLKPIAKFLTRNFAPYAHASDFAILLQ